MNNKTTVHLEFHNEESRKAPFVLHVEPWGDAYTLMPGESCELVAHFDGVEPSFGTVVWDHATQIYINNSYDWIVLQNGKEIYCGHNYEKALLTVPGGRSEGGDGCE